MSEYLSKKASLGWLKKRLDETQFVVEMVETETEWLWACQKRRSN